MKNIIDKFESNGEYIITPPKDKVEDDVILDKFQNYLDSLNNTKQ